MFILYFELRNFSPTATPMSTTSATRTAFCGLSTASGALSAGTSGRVCSAIRASGTTANNSCPADSITALGAFRIRNFDPPNLCTHSFAFQGFGGFHFVPSVIETRLGWQWYFCNECETAFQAAQQFGRQQRALLKRYVRSRQTVERLARESERSRVWVRKHLDEALERTRSLALQSTPVVAGLLGARVRRDGIPLTNAQKE